MAKRGESINPLCIQPLPDCGDTSANPDDDVVQRLYSPVNLADVHMRSWAYGQKLSHADGDLRQPETRSENGQA